jgi:hypothetical protein
VHGLGEQFLFFGEVEVHECHSGVTVGEGLPAYATAAVAKMPRPTTVSE